METKHFGLIGKNISYSFSKKYFEEKFQKLLLKNHFYELYNLQNINDFNELISKKKFAGLNVSIPYKIEIIPFLDELSEEAEKIGAVNCILFTDGKTKGFNTDAFGFEKTLQIHKKNHHQSALILGNGGAAKAVKYVLEKQNIPYKTVARNHNLNFENLTKQEVSEHFLIVQTTPVGTFPDVENVLKFPFDGLSDKHLIIDLIYNPAYTEFIKRAANRGAKTTNGYYMLEQQAEKTWKIWNF
ncbi:MAG: shikimate dehydrogenase [Flavobacteriaceae bacterium]|jgi:shikimate dehydrogenase|nr:shikimate dehydrogenase [Flavobacteriaceae bacterium]